MPSVTSNDLALIVGVVGGLVVTLGAHARSEGTVVGSVCLSARVCLLLNISLLQCSFVSQTIRLT